MSLQVPPRAVTMRAGDMACFDDEGLATFLDPRDGGVDPAMLGRALQDCEATLIDRVRAALPAAALTQFHVAYRATADGAAVAAASADVVAQLFWPLLYWNHPADYCALIDGEAVEHAMLDVLPLSGRSVCDIGAGTGRFTCAALEREASSVVAVDAVPPLLDILRERVSRLGLGGCVDIRRGRFSALPVADGSVDCAVAYSAFMPQGPHGGAGALREAERITKRGGIVAVLWPQETDWLVAQGYARIDVAGDPVRHFPSVDAALWACRNFYGDAATRWVSERRSAAVPFTVLGMQPPTVVCLRQM